MIEYQQITQQTKLGAVHRNGADFALGCRLQLERGGHQTNNGVRVSVDSHTISDPRTLHKKERKKGENKEKEKEKDLRNSPPKRYD